MNIKELRELTGQTQKEFAQSFGIPLGTLRRWEYGESTPAPYIVRMIAERIPRQNDAFRKIESENGTYFLDETEMKIMDIKGTQIPVSEEITGVKEMTPEQIKIRYERNFADTEYMLKKAPAWHS